jgi:hypothetical protein
VIQGRWWHGAVILFVLVSLFVAMFYVAGSVLVGIVFALHSATTIARDAVVAVEDWRHGVDARRCYRLDLSVFDAKLAAHWRNVTEARQAEGWLRDASLPSPPALRVSLVAQRRDWLAHGPIWLSAMAEIRPLGLTCRAMREHVLPALLGCYGPRLTVIEQDTCDDDPAWWYLLATYVDDDTATTACRAARHVDVYWTVRERQRMLTGPVVECPHSPPQ